MEKESAKKTKARKTFSRLNDPEYGKYDEKKHCTILLMVMDSDKPYISEFCRRVGVHKSTAFRWRNKHEMFKRCYDYGIELSYSNWLAEAEDMKDNAEFNFDFWKLKGGILFQLYQSRRLKLYINKDDTPYEQYKSIMAAASEGEFTATEIKQLMESINVGIRAYESHELSRQVEEIRRDALKMRDHYGEDITAIEFIAKDDKNTLQNSLCGPGNTSE